MKRKKLTWYQWFFRSWLYLMLIWLLTGFALGTLTLLFPLRIWVNYARDNDLEHTTESLGVVILMLILGVVSFFISWKIFKWHLAKEKVSITILSITVPFICAAASLMLFMNPDIVNSGSSSTELSQRFTIGPYPTASKVHQLKAEGYTGIISLLHPSVVPFEPELIEEEEEASQKNSITLVKAPMLPWIGDNSASLKTIENIVKSSTGKYYIHCYLGKDRVNVVKNLIVKITGGSDINSEIGLSNRTFESMKSFERGNIYKLDNDIYMSPYPTDEEFLSFFLAGKVRSVVNMMGSTRENAEWNNREKKELQKTTVTFKHYPLPENASDDMITKIVDSILRLQRPIVIHKWNTTSEDTKNIRKHFFQKTGKQPINLATNVSETY